MSAASSWVIFPIASAPDGGETVKDVAQPYSRAAQDSHRIWGAPIGHTDRPMLTLPLGVRARLSGTRRDILEPARNS